MNLEDTLSGGLHARAANENFTKENNAEKIKAIADIDLLTALQAAISALRYKPGMNDQLIQIYEIKLCQLRDILGDFIEYW